ncbi:hypothetical protein [Microbacterium sp. NPDC055357]
MARTGGRNLWIAVPSVLACIAVVAGLVWLAAPMVPTAVDWVGDTLRANADAQEDAENQRTPVQLIADGDPLDCRDLYPDQLWAELIWHGDVLLSQNTARPVIAADDLVEALAPTVAVNCAWALGRNESITSTVSVISPDAIGIAQAALSAQGFSCSTAETALECARARGGVREEHIMRDDVWLSIVGTGWRPEDYANRLAAYIWG